MLGVFSGTIVDPPEELVAAGSRTPSSKTKASVLFDQFLEKNSPAVHVKIGHNEAILAYTHYNQSILNPRLFAVKDDIFCLFEGSLENLGSLIHYYGLSKGANEVMLLIEAYKVLRDRHPYPPSEMLSHFHGKFSFIIFDSSTSTIFVATDSEGKIPLYWGITADGYVGFANNLDLLKSACGKSLATFPQGCFYSKPFGELKSYEHPENKVTAIPAREEEICGATFTVEGGNVLNQAPLKALW
ncbi:Aluminum-induced protein [Zostera marina]|uniref:Aluminum-induced protein n=1 Tax=Zostera marina TaxID=29655 RepID=A0A0K9PDR0_ZOSMR|nr:Aluminum-induced protein [Zostera marina]